METEWKEEGGDNSNWHWLAESEWMLNQARMTDAGGDVTAMWATKKCVHFVCVSNDVWVIGKSVCLPVFSSTTLNSGLECGRDSERGRKNACMRMCFMCAAAACIITAMIWHVNVNDFYSILWVGMPIIILSYLSYAMSREVVLFAAVDAATAVVVCHQRVHSFVVVVVAVVAVTIPNA